MNPTTVLKTIKRKIGASRRPIPLSDEDIMDTIFEDTLPVFSNYFPLFIPFTVKASQYKVKDQVGVYFIDIGDELDILGISKIFKTESQIALQPRMQHHRDDLFSMQAMSDLVSATYVPETFKFIPPNKVEVFPKYINDTDFMLELKLVHPRHLTTIPLSLREEFLKLAEYDVKISLYAILKHDNNLNTAFGTIDLKLEDLENAEDKRESLIETWDTKYLKEPNRKKIFIA